MKKSIVSKKFYHRFMVLFLFFIFTYAGSPQKKPAISWLHPVAKEDFTELDKTVRKMKKPSSIEGLIKELKKITKTDWQKARAVYIWLTDNIAYDVRGYFSGNYSDTSPAGVFKNRVSVCQGYSELFVILGQGLGLETELISGYAKGYGYSNGRSFSRTNHAWNRVKINGKWYLMDSTWGAGYINGRSYHKDYKEYWFATIPELFVYHHLPENPAMQLLENPVTMKEYVNSRYIMSYVFSSLYDAGVSFAQLSETMKKYGALVKAYSIDQKVRILSAPITPSVKGGEETTFSFYAPESDQVVIVNNGSWNHAKGEDGIYTLKLIPKKGNLSVNFHARKSSSRSYSTMLAYKVY